MKQFTTTFLIITTLLFGVLGFGQTSLEAGDLALLQYNSDGSTETIKILVLKSLEANTTFSFTDKGYHSVDGFTGNGNNENTQTYTATSAIKCGEIISIDLVGLVLAANGDQIFLYQGAVGTPTFIFGLNVSGSSGTWQANRTNNSNSAIPSTLTNGINSVALPHIDNYKYNGPLVGNKSTILTAICDKINWIG
ncbi:MAG: hypothetical protein V3U80_08995, partial [Flavobacteriaceae bacterium]